MTDVLLNSWWYIAILENIKLCVNKWLIVNRIIRILLKQVKLNNFVKKMISGSFKNVFNKMCLEIIYLIYMYKEDLALNDLQWLICHETKAN